MEKDKATEYWDNEIKRAVEDTAKARDEWKQARKEEKRALDLKNFTEIYLVSEEMKEEAREIYRGKTLISSQKWDAYQMASKWEGVTRGAAESYKKRKAANEANK